jgi:hypothetical protein
MTNGVHPINTGDGQSAFEKRLAEIQFCKQSFILASYDLYHWTVVAQDDVKRCHQNDYR